MCQPSECVMAQGHKTTKVRSVVLFMFTGHLHFTCKGNFIKVLLGVVFTKHHVYI